MMERDALSQASVGISEALRHMDEARRLQPAVTHLREIHVDMGHLVSDVMFDNIFSDMAQHDRIKASNNQLMEAMAQLKEQITLQTQRAQSAKLALNQGEKGAAEYPCGGIPKTRWWRSIQCWQWRWCCGAATLCADGGSIWTADRIHRCLIVSPADFLVGKYASVIINQYMIDSTCH
jgi:hypothetical protein